MPSALGPLFQREFLGYFRGLVAYVFLAIFILAVTGLAWFVGGFFQGNDASLRTFFIFLPWVYLLFIPAVGMRLWAEERRSGTWELLFTYPLGVGQAVLAKFLAAWAFISLALLGTFTMALTVNYLGEPDWGPIFAGYFGAVLMAGSFLAICSLASALTRSQVIAFVLSVSVCFVLLMLGWSVGNQLMLGLGFPVWLVDALANFSFIPHFDPMTKGLITLGDVLFFGVLIGFCLWVNTVVLER